MRTCRALRRAAFMIALAFLPTGAGAQALPVVAVLSWWSDATERDQVFMSELGRLGYVHGRTILFEQHYAAGSAPRAAAMAQDLARRNVDVIIALATPAAAAAKSATSTIPVIFRVADPLA